ncbi:type ISP restriction/modification enzyme, partial [Planktothrix sp.]
IIGNPPYNASQVNENDNNKNRKYTTKDKTGIDDQVAATYSKDSKATNKNALSDPYVKAFRWASDRIGDEGIIALVTNNSFINEIAFDGMRCNLAKDFDVIYILDLGGNVRKNPKISGTTHNVFGIQVGVSINLLIRKKDQRSQPTQIYYARVDEYWRKEEKYNYLNQCQKWDGVQWQTIEPDKRYIWLTEGLQYDFDTFIPIGNKETKNKSSNDSAIFRLYSIGVQTSRDAWVFNYKIDELTKNVKFFIDNYNHQLYKWENQRNPNDTIDQFVDYNDNKMKWSSSLKSSLNSNTKLELDLNKIRKSLYRPFCLQFLYFDYILNHRRGLFVKILPTLHNEQENRVIWLKVGSEVPIFCLMVNVIPELLPQGGSQCFPFYTYNKDGKKRKENITKWSLEQFRNYYQDRTITKWDIFYYTYGLLHHPTYRERYAANLKRELPRIPYAPDFRGFVNAGQQLADLHLNYEQQPEYNLKFIENDQVPLNWRVEKMKLSKDKTQIIYNEFLTLSGIPPEVFEYRLGNRSALDWIIDQYQVKIDKRSGIVNDPNRLDDEQYIVRLIGQVITVSLETVKIVKNLPDLG